MRWFLVPPLRQFVVLAATASLLLNVAMLVPSLFTLQVFDRVFASRSMETLVMLSALTLLSLVFAYCMDVVRARALASAGRLLHRVIAPAALEQSLGQAAIGARADADSLRDATRLRNFLGSGAVRALFDAPWVPIYLFVIALMHPLLAMAALLGAVVLVLLAIATDRLTRDLIDATLRQSRNVGRYAGALTRSAEILVAMGMSANAMRTWRSAHAELLDEQTRLHAVSARMSALARVARQAVQMAVLAIGAWLVVDTGASPGIMIAATILLGRALQPVEYLISGWKQLVDARGAWRRLSEPDALPVPLTRLRLPPPVGRLELDRVAFTHDPARPPVINGVSFAVQAGESIGLVGASGSGKTTLVRLLLGVWKPQSGVVRLDDADIAHWDRNDLGAHIGYLPQDVSLFEGTVAQNIARLGSVDPERVIEAARLAHAHDMILRLPAGYDTLVGDAGARLSGGQRQRIALARALYERPKLVVLDEPDANLDAEGQHALKSAIRALSAARVTVIVVGHRTGLLAEVNRIAVLKDGTIQAIGPASAMLAGPKSHNVHPLPAPIAPVREAAA